MTRTHGRLMEHEGEIDDIQHGLRKAGLHGDSHVRLHALDDPLDHSGTITDAQHGVRTLLNAHSLDQLAGIISDVQHGVRGSGLHSDSHVRLHTLTSVLDHSGEISDTQHGSRGAGLHGDSHVRLHALDDPLDHSGEITDTQHGIRTLANAHSHANLSGVSSNQHHNKSHNLKDSDHPDVGISSPANGQMLIYNSATGKWENLDPNVTVLDVTKTVTQYIINLTVTGIIRTPASGKKIRLKSFTWSSNADIVTALRFGAGGDLLFAIQAKGVIGMNLIGCNIEGAANEALYGYLSAAGTMQGTILVEEI